MKTARIDQPVRIVVVDDQRLCRECVRLLIESIDPTLEVVEAANPDEIGVVFGEGEHRDVVLYNLVIADGYGFDFVDKLAQSAGDTPLVVMCDAEDSDLMRGCLDRGAKAFLPSSTPGPLLVAVLRLVIAGGIYAPPEISVGAGLNNARARGADENSVRRGAAIAKNFPSLTRRQRDVLALLSRGMSNRDIAETLAMCENTVKAHVKQVMRKLQAENRTQAALMADRLVS